jgi:hypothetical protein
MTTDSGEVSEAPKDLRGFSSGGESVCSNKCRSTTCSTSSGAMTRPRFAGAENSDDIAQRT